MSVLIVSDKMEHPQRLLQVAKPDNYVTCHKSCHVQVHVQLDKTVSSNWKTFLSCGKIRNLVKILHRIHETVYVIM